MRKIIAALLLCVGVACHAQDPLAPLMGWSSWNTFALDISAQLIMDQATAMATSGLKDAGFTYVNIDDGYFYGRDERGHLRVNPATFPDGFQPVIDHIHSLGLKAGIYSDCGRGTCGWNGTLDSLAANVGFYGHDQQDADFFFRELDFDFIKIDFCGGSGANSEKLVLNARERYTDISRAIANTGRNPEVRINACRWAYPGTWIDGVCGSWRTTGDIYLDWKSVRSILAENLYLADYSSPGHFNDMDMLEVGRGLTLEEDRTHFGLWCVMNSPLLIGCDMTKITPETMELLTNKELIAVNQDKTFQQAYVVKKAGECFVLARDVERIGGKTRVVAFYNPSDESQTVSLPLRDIDLYGARTTLRDLFNHADATALVFNANEQTINVSVPAHGTYIYKVWGERRLERRRYEAETAYNPSYQELANHQLSQTGWYNYSDACSGGLKATWLGRSESNALHFRHVASKRGGSYRLTIAYLSGEPRDIRVMVNGQEAGFLTVEPAGWDKVATTSVDITLTKGENSVVLMNSVGWMPDIDYIDIVPLS